MNCRCVALVAFLLGLCGCGNSRSDPQNEQNDTSVISERSKPRHSALKPNMLVPVLFTTDRRMRDEGGRVIFEPGRDDRKSRGEDLKFGKIDVLIPSAMQRGTAADFTFWKTVSGSSRERLPILKAPGKMGLPDWRDELRRQIASAPRRAALVFVHGYSNSFEDAVSRAATIAFLLRFDGPTIVYSWPSMGTPQGYPADEATVRISAARLTKALAEIVSRTDVEKVYLVAHSMGTRLLSDSLIRLAAQEPRTRDRVQAVILAAADIDAQFFEEEIGPKLIENAQNVTLYSSSHDKALLLSRTFHNFRQAGDTRNGVVVLAGMDTIDASEADTSFIGHAYIAENPDILQDMFDLVNKNSRPPRPLLFRRYAGKQPYWYFSRR